MKTTLLTVFVILCFYSSTLFAQGTNCSNAITLPLNGTCNSYSVSSATGGAVDCNGQGYNGNGGQITYFKFTTNSIPECVSLDMQTSTANVTMEAALYSGCSGTTATGLDNDQNICMNDGNGIWATNLDIANLNANTTYYLRVRTEPGFAGTIQICGKYDSPSNNLCSGSTGIDDLVTPNQNNACNVGSTEVAPSTLCAGSLQNTAWYTFTVLSTGVSSVIISNLNCDNSRIRGNNNGYGFQIGFFTGNCGSLVPSSCQQIVGSGGGTAIASSTSFAAGTVVHVAIDGISGSNCKYSINAINAAPLSVKMRSFDGWRANDFNLLTWITSSERDHQYFEVERSTDGINFLPMGRVNGVGNSSDEKRYSFKDQKPLSIGYYRLKQVDAHNNISYSRIIRIDRPVTSSLSAVFENPVHGILKANLESSDAGMAEVRVVDVSGKTIFTGSVILQKGNNRYHHNLNKLIPGTYYLVITKDDTRKTFPFIKF